MYVKGADNLDPTARLEDLKITREIAIKCGLKTKVIAAPSANAEPTEIKVHSYFAVLFSIPSCKMPIHLTG